jgi:hypothetical protein
MVAGQNAQNQSASPADQELPPITPLAAVSLALIIIGGIYIAAYLPTIPSLTLPVILLIGSVGVLTVTLLMLSRVRTFAWRTFFVVGRWTLLAYLIIAGMLEYVFVSDGTRGSGLLLLTLMLAVYAIDIPLLLSYSVARYQPPE